MGKWKETTLIRLNSIGKKIYAILGIAITCSCILFVFALLASAIMSSVGDISRGEREHTVRQVTATRSFYKYLSSRDEDYFHEFTENLKVSINQAASFAFLPEEIEKHSITEAARGFDDHLETINYGGALVITIIVKYVSFLPLFAELNVVASGVKCIARRIIPEIPYDFLKIIHYNSGIELVFSILNSKTLKNTIHQRSF